MYHFLSLFQVKIMAGREEGPIEKVTKCWTKHNLGTMFTV